MRVDPTKLSIREIYDRFVAQGEPASLSVIRAMKKDPRGGARRIHQMIRKKQKAERCEKLRLVAMMRFERALWNSGTRYVAGVDEAGVGPLAGPVVAAAVVFPPEIEIRGVDDSKQLDPKARMKLALEIREKADGVGVGSAEVAEIDKMNVYHAGILAMKRAVEKLPVHPEHILVDARTIPDLPIPQSSFCKGDRVNFSIAAASIIAKTCRDQLMEEFDHRYPGYGFARHKGYSTPEHMREIQARGPSPLHRRSFHFIEELCGEYSDLFYWLRGRLRNLTSAQEMNVFERDFQRARTGLARVERRKLRLMVARRRRLLASNDLNVGNRVNRLPV